MIKNNEMIMSNKSMNNINNQNKKLGITVKGK